MGTRSNPFYRYQNPALGQGFSGLAAAMFPQPDKTQSEIAAREAQAAANMALAAERDENTRGSMIRNDRYEAMPTDLAQLFMSGGRLQDELPVLNPEWRESGPIDWSQRNILTEGLPQQPDPLLSTGRSATDQFAAALQQMEAYGFRPDQIMDAIGRMQYLNRAGGDDPQSGLPFLPFVGGTPNAGTALTSADQDRISARDAGESLTQALAVEDSRNQNRINVETLKQDRQDARGPSGTQTIPSVLSSTGKGIRAEVEDRLSELGFNSIEPGAVNEVVDLASRLFQDQNSPAWKNAVMAASLAVEMVESGQSPAVREVLGRRWFRDTTSLERVPLSERPAPAAQNEGRVITDARAAIARGAPRDAVIQRLKDNGITPPEDL